MSIINIEFSFYGDCIMTVNLYQPTRAIDVVYCYSDNEEDRNLKDELEKHLMAMQREGIITTWHEDKIGAGQEWREQVTFAYLFSHDSHSYS